MAIERRRFILQAAGAAIGAGLAAAGPSGCGGRASAEGPIPIHWDRDVCAGCGMVISDRRFACETCGGPRRRIELFDDLGCALTWLARQDWGAAATTRIWVNDPKAPGQTSWCDARAVLYRHDRHTPMGYDYSPAVPGTAGALSFEDVRERVAGKRSQ